MTRFSNPLEWPAGWRRTPPNERKPARFSASIGDSLELLFDEIEKLNGEYETVTGDFVIGKRGSILEEQPRGADPAVAVYFDRAGERLCIPCDRWIWFADNLRAVALTVKTIRDLERWGSAQIIARAFEGFRALPAPRATDPFSVLGLDRRSSTVDDVRAAYRKHARRLHPDTGGDGEAFRRLTDSYSAAMLELGSPA